MRKPRCWNQQKKYLKELFTIMLKDAKKNVLTINETRENPKSKIEIIIKMKWKSYK